ncbi:hypothetical protein BCO18430_06487 [Burkholderia contaminans]|nr:hypothetical protein BCO18430_06487 [Burkholderia contaminans]
MAQVNRSNLYTSHRELISLILGRDVSRRDQATKSAVKVNSSQESAKQERVSNREKALLYMCLELHVEVKRLRALQKQVKKL